MRRLLATLPIGLALACGGPPAGTTSAAPGALRPDADAVEIPSEFAADRVFVKPALKSGKTVRLYTDSGGGSQFLFADAARRLGLRPTTVEFEEKAEIVAIPEWREGAGIPPPLGIHQPKELRTSFLVFERKGELARFGADEDGFLGQGWLGGRVWTWDYPGRHLWWHRTGKVPPHRPEEEVVLHFPLEDDGQPSMHFARITIEVDGEPLDLLLDTGATLDVTPAAVAVLGPGPAERATSFIAKNRFDRWRQRNPGWRVVDKAERELGSPIIEVPKVRIAGQEVGPVWFTFRPDANFHDYMSKMMDAKVDGALGGSAFRYFRMTVDYPRRMAIFQR